jgi:tripartite-type tricarboxylate transporter receptor subunit TctC
MSALRRRGLVLPVFFSGWLAASALAQAPAYPVRPIHFIIPYTAGMIDTTARAVAQHLSERLGQPVVPENRPGASQIIALDAVAKSAPDGYTLVMGTQSGLVLLTASRKTLPYDPVRDFASITLLFTTPFYLTVHPSLPVRTVEELIALAKSQPGKLNYASVGPGSGHHLVTEMFRTKAGVDIVHVPYKGSTMAQTGLMAGDVQMMFEGPAILGLARGGKVRALASSGRERAQAAPELPTVGESLPGFEMATWFGLSAPAGVPRPIVDRLNREAGDFLRSAAARQKFGALSIELTASTPEEMSERIRTDLPVWTKLMRSSGIEPE